MMKRLFLLFAMLLLVLVACGDGDTAVFQETPVHPKSASPTATKIVLDVNEYPLTQIGNSDKYQFLNAYASW